MLFAGKNINIDVLNALLKGTLSETLGMQVVEIGENHLIFSMPVDRRTIQPSGVLDGGASMALAESVASLAGNLVVNPSHFCVGIEINGNHIKAVRKGLVYGKAMPVHIGKSTHVWSVEITNESSEMVCISRMTLLVKPAN